MSIHPTAIIAEEAELGQDTSIGPYSYIGSQVKIGDDCDIRSHVVVDGYTTIGNRAIIFPFAAVGAIPMDKKFSGESTRLEIGDDVTIREHVTLHLGTKSGGGYTRVGNNVLLMVGAHIAHDAIVGNSVVIAANAMLAGHVVIGDHVVIGAGAGVCQFMRVGPYAMVGALSLIVKNVLPYSIVIDQGAHLKGANLVGLKRNGFTKKQIFDLRRAFDILLRKENLMKDYVSLFRSQGSSSPELAELADFIENSGSRGITL